MGRSVPTFRYILEKELEKLREVVKVARPNEKIVVNEIVKAARNLADLGGMVDSVDIFKIVLFLALINLTDRVKKLEAKSNGGVDIRSQ
jgi:energy-converting hydrogenase Eha subunit H